MIRPEPKFSVGQMAACISPVVPASRTEILGVVWIPEKTRFTLPFGRRGRSWGFWAYKVSHTREWLIGENHLRPLPDHDTGEIEEVIELLRPFMQGAKCA